MQQISNYLLYYSYILLLHCRCYFQCSFCRKVQVHANEAHKLVTSKYLISKVKGLCKCKEEIVPSNCKWRRLLKKDVQVSTVIVVELFGLGLWTLSIVSVAFFVLPPFFLEIRSIFIICTIYPMRQPMSSKSNYIKPQSPLLNLY